MRLTAHLAIKCLIANYCIRWRGIFKGLSHDGGQADFSKNRRASSFNKDLSNEPNFGRIHLAGQVPLKVPKCEIFHLFDFHDFYGIKSL